MIRIHPMKMRKLKRMKIHFNFLRILLFKVIRIKIMIDLELKTIMINTNRRNKEISNLLILIRFNQVFCNSNCNRIKTQIMVDLTFKDLMFKGEIEIIQLVILSREEIYNKIKITPLMVVVKNHL